MSTSAHGASSALVSSKQFFNVGIRIARVSNMTQGQRQSVNHPSAWRRADLLRDQSWIYQLEKQDLQDIEHALRAVQKQDRIWGEFPATQFPLPTLGAKLRRMQTEIRTGRGVVLV